MKRSLYPANWEEISRRIRFERANNKCEQCGVPNGEYIIRDGADPAKWRIVSLEDDRIVNPMAKRAIKVVLTVAHMDHNPANNAETNLKALCQRCHLRHDAKEHGKKAAQTRREKKHAGQLSFLTDMVEK